MTFHHAVDASPPSTHPTFARAQVGIAVAELRLSGFAPSELHAAGCAVAELKAGGAVALATHACSNEVASLGYVDKYEAKVKILRLPTAF